MRTIASFRLIHESAGTAANVTERLGLEPTRMSEGPGDLWLDVYKDTENI